MMSILVVKHGALGDVIRTAYILPGLYKRYGDVRICWYTAPTSVPLLRFNPYVTEILAGTNSCDALCSREFDLVISLDDEREILEKLEGIRYKKFVGAYLGSDGKSAYTDSAAEWFDMGLISKYGKERADELKKLNNKEHNQIFAKMLEIEIDRPIFFNSSVIESSIGRRFDDAFYNIGLNSGAGARWASKQLPLDETIKLVNALLSRTIGNKEVRVYLLGGKEEEKRHLEICNAVSSNRLIDAGNDNSLLEFAAIVKSCDFVITSDSLALHLAISQNVRNVSFYAPTSADEIGTFGVGEKVVSTAADYCSYRKDTDNSTITAERLLDSISQLWNRLNTNVF